MSIHTGGNGHEPHYKLPEPHSNLAPEDVVRIVLDALQHNDFPGPDFGVRVAFNFASPANRSATGPLARFAGMVRNARYNILIDFKDAQIEPAAISGEHARLTVRVTGQDDRTASFIFQLSRQTNPPFRGCWMTDGVLPAG